MPRPLLRVDARPAQQRQGKVVEQPRIFCRLNEIVGTQNPAVGVIPAGQTFEPRPRTVGVADDTMVEAIFQYNLSRVELARSKGEVRTVLTEKAP